eukprot:4487297-Alexandrium_andersonii.AAC.1
MSQSVSVCHLSITCCVHASASVPHRPQDAENLLIGLAKRFVQGDITQDSLYEHRDSEMAKMGLHVKKKPAAASAGIGAESSKHIQVACS